MSTLTAVLIIAGVVAVGVPAVWWQIRAAEREESQKDRFIREACAAGLGVWDDRLNRWITLPPGIKPGPHQYTDREVDALDQLELVWEAPAYVRAAVDPSWAAGLERLWDAARDEHTNTPEGDT